MIDEALLMKSKSALPFPFKYIRNKSGQWSNECSLLMNALDELIYL